MAIKKLHHALGHDRGLPESHGHCMIQRIVLDHAEDCKRPAEKMTGAESRLLKTGDRVCWRGEKSDQGTVTDGNWSGVTLNWDSRCLQSILHNDMQLFSLFSENDCDEIGKVEGCIGGSACPACKGTGFPSVAQAAKPGRRIYPLTCKQCLGKGRLARE
ncbi:hypothetical protein FIU28_04935 [Tardiphaga sp. vice154]|uniref:hypothetical protein n=1 Tax=Tardiphaga sp. vice154 TaxID=2592814 RepID=UPI001165B8E9|nr:hypothetical protein [Tardiphaga sp. vice154]QDM20557.1 hypothetical protein FIU28_04935 [Tardiphaga sp. vice154]